MLKRTLLAFVVIACGGWWPYSASSFQPTVENVVRAIGDPPLGMVWIPGGEFSMGAAESTDMNAVAMQATADSRPVHRVYVHGFWMDATEMTNEQFAEFVDATGYVTMAERDLVAGDAKRGNWRHPDGPESSLAGRERYPVVQIAFEDAVAYAAWAGKRLPTEAEWEFAARGGLSGKLYAWGDEFTPSGHWMANTYQGHYPDKDFGEDGHRGIGAVAQFLPNRYGLYDVAGNVWEWVNDWYRPDYYTQLASAGVARNPSGPESPFDPREPMAKKRVMRGGSFLCTDQYCSRYMVGTRGKGEASTGTNDVGFRLVKDAGYSARK